MSITLRAIFLMIFVGFSIQCAAQLTDTIPARQTNEKMARELSNPNNPFATVHLKLQSYLYDGNLPESRKSAMAFVLQPSFPFRLKNGNRIFIRPAIPFWFSKPVINHNGKIESGAGLGDIQWDMLYGMAFLHEWKLGIGLLNTFPTASGNIGSQAFVSGPNIIIIKQYRIVTLTLDLRNQRNVGNYAGKVSNVSTIKPTASVLTGKGWSIGSGPQMDFNHSAGTWTIPFNLNISRTNQGRNNHVWKFNAEINYYVSRPENFSSKWYFLIDISPLVKNFFVQ